jgi:DNA invertase Pin-like site-specific DNA recombinase
VQKYITYIRVSSERQGRSGLGLAAQEEAAQQYAAREGGKIVGSFREVETGKNGIRPQLQAAIARCRREKAVLLVAKIDRLFRNLQFLTALMNSDVPFVAADNANASRLTLHILGAVAEDEARRISQRTREALAQAKARGKLLGSARPGHWEGKEEVRLAALSKARERAAELKRNKHLEALEGFRPIISDMLEAGATQQAIADKFNEDGLTTPTGGVWNAVSIHRAIKACGISKGGDA